MNGAEKDDEIVALCHCKAMKKLFLIDTSTGNAVRELGEGTKYVDPSPTCDPSENWENAGENKQIIFGFSCPTRQDMINWSGAYNMMEETLALAEGKPGWSNLGNRTARKGVPVLHVGGKVIFPTYSLDKEKLSLNNIKQFGTGELKMDPFNPANPGAKRGFNPVPNTTWTVEFDENPRFVLVTESMAPDGKLKADSAALKYFPQFPVLVFTYHGPKVAGRRRRTRKGRGGTIPPATSAYDLEQRKLHLIPISPRVKGARRRTRRQTRRLRR
jgi:hypothetical protein